MNSSTINSDAKKAARGFLLGLLSTLVVFCAITYVLVAPIAPQFTGNVSFDEKIRFLRDGFAGLKTQSASEKLTLVIGSSMALNNVDTNILSDRTKKPYLNLGVWGMRAGDAFKLGVQVADRLPVSYIILSTQFFELRDDALTHFSMSDEVLNKYLYRGKLFGEIESRDFYRALRLRQKWKKDHEGPHSYTNVMFNRTGAVPLDIDESERDPARWLPDQLFPEACAHCMNEIDAVCHSAKERGMGFSVVLPPLAHWVREKRPEVGALYEERKARLRVTLKACDAALFDAAEWADFDDSCFADFSHLNREGMRQMSEMIAYWRQGGKVSSRRSVSCKLAR